MTCYMSLRRMEPQVENVRIAEPERAFFAARHESRAVMGGIFLCVSCSLKGAEIFNRTPLPSPGHILLANRCESWYTS